MIIYIQVLNCLYMHFLTIHTEFKSLSCIYTLDYLPFGLCPLSSVKKKQCNVAESRPPVHSLRTTPLNGPNPVGAYLPTWEWKKIQFWKSNISWCFSTTLDNAKSPQIKQFYTIICTWSNALHVILSQQTLVPTLHNTLSTAKVREVIGSTKNTVRNLGHYLSRHIMIHTDHLVEWWVGRSHNGWPCSYGHDKDGTELRWDTDKNDQGSR